MITVQLIKNLSLFSSLPLVRSVECITPLSKEHEGQEGQGKRKQTKPNTFKRPPNTGRGADPIGVDPRPRSWEPWEPDIETGDPPERGWGAEYTTCVTNSHEEEYYE